MICPSWHEPKSPKPALSLVLLPAGAEDDGYLATYVYDSASDSSSFVVYDARTCSERPVASARLPQRVPYGFHGLHINAAQFESMFPFDIHFLPSVD